MSQLNNDANRVLTVMRRRSLIFQTRDNYKKYHGIDSSIIMGTEKGFDPSNPKQICSIDTVSRRIKSGKIDFLKFFDLIIVDESHDTTSRNYQDFFHWLGGKYFIGLTATPYRVGNKVHSWWDSVVQAITPSELMEKGFLVPEITYTPQKIDLSEIKTISGDFHQGQLGEKMSSMSVVGNVVENYKKYGQGKKAILFAVNIEHSKLLVKSFNESGIPAVHCDQGTPQIEREAHISDLKAGKIKVLSNVNIFSTGVDIPFAEIGLMARPTMSEILYIQQAGRILRPYKVCICGNEYGGDKSCFKCGSSKTTYVKERAIFLDHGANTGRHGLIYQDRIAAMTGKNKKSDRTMSVKQCPECWGWNASNGSKCTGCGYVFTSENSDVKTEDGDLELINERDLILNHYSKYQKEMRYKNTTKNYPYEMIYRKFGSLSFKYINFPVEFRTKIIKENHDKVYR